MLISPSQYYVTIVGLWHCLKSYMKVRQINQLPILAYVTLYCLEFFIHKHYRIKYVPCMHVNMFFVCL